MFHKLFGGTVDAPGTSKYPGLAMGVKKHMLINLNSYLLMGLFLHFLYLK